MKKVILIRNAAYHDFGGGERLPIFLAEYLNKHGYEAVVISSSPKILHFAHSNKLRTISGLWWQRQNWSGLNLLFLPLYIGWQIILYFWYFFIFVKENPNIVHVQSKDDFIAATFAAKTLAKKVIWTDHADLKHIWKNIGIWYKNPVGKIVYLASFLANKIVAVSQSEKELISSCLPINSPVLNKMILIYNGIEDKIKLYPKLKQNKVFTYVIANRLVTDKGIGETVDAFNALSSEHDNVTLKILGSGPEEERFKKNAKGNYKITFFGHLEDPLQEMSSSDVFLQPTYHEAFSVVLVEASMLGLPIIATNVGGNPELISNKKNGILVKARSSNDLYKAMEQLYRDEKLRITIAKEARKTYESKFDFNIIAKKYVDIYEK